jgi:hypothetical protein
MGSASVSGWSGANHICAREVITGGRPTDGSEPPDRGLAGPAIRTAASSGLRPDGLPSVSCRVRLSSDVPLVSGRHVAKMVPDHVLDIPVGKAGAGSTR